MAKSLGIAPAYLYQMVKGIRPISAERVIAICKVTGWAVTPHEVRPDIYPNPGDGIPPSEAITTASTEGFTPHTGGGCMYSADAVDRRKSERRDYERRSV